MAVWPVLVHRIRSNGLVCDLSESTAVRFGVASGVLGWVRLETRPCLSNRGFYRHPPAPSNDRTAPVATAMPEVHLWASRWRIAMAARDAFSSFWALVG